MRLSGSQEFEQFWMYFERESPRGAAIVVAAYFDEKLGQMLGAKKGDFNARINLSSARGLLSRGETHDLHEIRKLRNDFAHDLAAIDFDTDKATKVNHLITWQSAAQTFPAYEGLFVSPRERLLYVAACFYVRFEHRKIPPVSPVPEPPLWDTKSWIIVTSHP